ncbi:MAG: PQQ-binding-like beta-propeller repeat protein [Aureliella sp.]
MKLLLNPITSNLVSTLQSAKDACSLVFIFVALGVAGLPHFAYPPNVLSQTIEDNWHQWRGPHANGYSATATPPVTWSETENIRWKVAIDGKGTSTPVIWGDRVFVLTAIKNGNKDTSIPDPKDQPKTNFFDIKRPNEARDFVVICLDRSSGQERWRDIAISKIPHEGAHQDNDFASASPTTDGERLYCWFGSAGLFAYSLDGTKLWQRNLGEVTVGSSLGEGGSPVIHEGNLIIVRDHQGESSIEVLDATTGKTKWRQPRDEGNAWATPVVIATPESTQVVTAASGAIRSYDLNTGEVIWQCSGLTGNVTPGPIQFEDSVICMSGYQGYAALAVPYLLRGPLPVDNVIWKVERDTPYIPSPLLIGDKLYFVKSNQSLLSCLDAATGQKIFGPKRLGQLGNIYASIVGAQDRVYLVGRQGTTMVLRDGQGAETLAINQLDEKFDASPALSGSQLFLRGERFLYCIEKASK